MNKTTASAPKISASHQTKGAGTNSAAHSQNEKTVIAISPYTEGFGYAVFNSQQNLMDWGVTRLGLRKFPQVLNRFEMLLKRYRPHAVTIQTPHHHAKYKSLAQKIVHALSQRCAVNSTPFLRLKRSDIANLFVQFDAHTKEQIAAKLVEFLPELKIYKPKHRAIWEREDTNMKIFDATSLGLTFYDQLDGSQLPYFEDKDKNQAATK